MNENKNEALLSDEQVDELLQNFQAEAKNNINPEDESFNKTVIPDRMETEKEQQIISENLSNAASQSDTYNIESVTKENEKVNSKDAPASNKEIGAPNLAASGKSKKTRPFEIILGNVIKFIAILLFVAISTWLLSSGDKMSLTSVTASERDRTSVFSSSASNLMSDSLQEIHNMPKVYILAQNDDPAPVPNQSNFTKIEDPEHQNYDGTPIDYYKDETIEVKCWREMIDGAVFNFADVQIAHPSQFKRKLVDNVISKKHLDYPLNIFKNMNGVVGMTSDYCAYRGYGTIVQYGNIVRDEPYKNLDLLIYDKDGNLSYIADSQFRNSEYYNSEDVIFTFAFGPMLVNDYTVNTSKKMQEYPTGEVSSHYPRAAIGQFDYDKHYLLCTVDYTDKKIRGTTVTRLAEVMQEKGCRFAYNMDGGQTGALMFNNELFNVVAYGGQREVSDIMYFASAIPNN